MAVNHGPWAALFRKSYPLSLGEGQRQLTILALASLGLERPGFDEMLWEIARKLEGGALYEELKAANADRVKESRMPL